MRPTTQFIRGGPSQRGACAAELALLFAFVYLPLVIGSIYVGWLAAARQRVHEANHYTILDKNDQTVGEIAGKFFSEFTGQVVEVVDQDDPDAEVPTPGELRSLFEAFAKPIHFQTDPSAHVEFSLVGNAVVPHMVVTPGTEGYHVRPEGDKVNEWKLLDDNIPENLTDLLSEYLRRREARTSYLHSWVFYDEGKKHDVDQEAWAPSAGGSVSRWVAEDSPEGPTRRLRARGDPSTTSWNLYVPNPAFRDQWTPEAAVRWEKERTAAMGRAEYGSGSAPPKDDSKDFWHPGDETKKGGTTP